jgi:hypothetical protein
VTPHRQLILGKTLVALGCLWFFLILFRIPPLFSLIFMFLTWLRPRPGLDEILTIVYGREYITALATVAFGVMVWRRARIGRWPLKLMFALLVLSILAAGTRYELKKQAQTGREAVYETKLRSYSEVLKPGMRRKEVESYLGEKNTTFTQMCCVDAETLSERSSWDDLVKMGKDDAPWFCSENDVYIAFQFTDHERKREPGWTANDLDTLKSVTVYRWLEGCL